MKLLLNAGYAKTHEWALKDVDEFLVALPITPRIPCHIVYVELPEVGDVLDKVRTSAWSSR